MCEIHISQTGKYKYVIRLGSYRDPSKLILTASFMQNDILLLSAIFSEALSTTYSTASVEWATRGEQSAVSANTFRNNTKLQRLSSNKTKNLTVYKQTKPACWLAWIFQWGFEGYKFSPAHRRTCNPSSLSMKIPQTGVWRFSRNSSRLDVLLHMMSDAKNAGPH